MPALVITRRVGLVLAAVLFPLPFHVMVRDGLTAGWSTVTEPFTDGEIPFARSLLNSVIVAVPQTLGQLVLGSLAGRGQARIPTGTRRRSCTRSRICAA